MKILSELFFFLVSFLQTKKRKETMLQYYPISSTTQFAFCLFLFGKRSSVLKSKQCVTFLNTHTRLYFTSCIQRKARNLMFNPLQW